jgi:hypothetical protein
MCCMRLQQLARVLTLPDEGSSVQGRFTGIFATHQHDLLDARLGLLSRLPRTAPARMLTTRSPAQPSLSLDSGAPLADEGEAGAERRPLFKVVEGASRESLAFEVAAAQVRLNALAPTFLWTRDQAISLLLCLGLSMVAAHLMRCLPLALARIPRAQCQRQ